MRLWLLAFLLTISLQAHAEDWTTTDGTTYHGIKVISHDDGYVTVFDSDGGAKIPLRLLNPDLQKRFGYNAKKAAASEQAETAQDRAERAAVLAADRAALAPAPRAPEAGQPEKVVASPVAPSTPPPVPSPTAAAPVNFGLIQNGDFSRGDSGWEGDGETPRAYAQSHPGALADPVTSRGLIVPLDPQAWTRIYQTFQADQGTRYSLAVQFRVSPHLTMSKNAADYADISKRIRIDGFENFGSITVQPGEFYGTVGDPTSTTVAMEVFSPKLGSGDIQTYQHTYPPLPAGGNKTVALAFPPGTGTVAILSVSVTSK